MKLKLLNNPLDTLELALFKAVLKAAQHVGATSVSCDATFWFPDDRPVGMDSDVELFISIACANRTLEQWTTGNPSSTDIEDQFLRALKWHAPRFMQPGVTAQVLLAPWHLPRWPARIDEGW